jgi:hypothetical protein
MDDQTLDSIAELICGDFEGAPTYRSGSELTRFFQRVGFSNFKHDGSTRKWWTLDVLRSLTPSNLNAVILRLANPREYKGDVATVQLATRRLNEILMIEGLKVTIKGVTPSIVETEPQFSEEETIELKPLDPPEFISLNLDPGLGEILSNRWEETQRCIDSEAYLSATILMGTMLEGILLAVLSKYPQIANCSVCAPKDSESGKVKKYHEWSLYDMINVSHDVEWLGLDVKKFSHSLREFRNIIHPYEQMVSGATPDKDTCAISWLVVQAAINDLAKELN